MELIDKNPDFQKTLIPGTRPGLEADLENQRAVIRDLHRQVQLLEHLRAENERKTHQLNMVYDSWSWRIGRAVTRSAEVLFFFVPDLLSFVNRTAATFRKLHISLNDFFRLRIFHRPANLTDKPVPGKLNFNDQLTVTYGAHRSGWSYAIANLAQLHNPNGVLFDTFIERTFFWHPDGVKPHTQPWVGVIHVPPKVPTWFQYEQSNEAIFSSEAWKESEKHCRGLYTMSAYHKKILEKRFDFPVNNLIHPTEFPECKWSWKRFQSNREKKIVQIGWWLRKLHSIYLLPTTRYAKVFLRKEDADMNEIMRLEREHMDNMEMLTDEIMNSATTVSFLPNDEYDRLLSENVVFLELYDSSANNAVIECMARNTPILVNRIEPVIEYLGNDYPLLYDTLDEAARKADDFALIKSAHQFLANHPTKQKLTGKYFLESVRSSEIYRKL